MQLEKQGQEDSCIKRGVFELLFRKRTGLPIRQARVLV